MKPMDKALNHLQVKLQPEIDKFRQETGIPYIGVTVVVYPNDGPGFARVLESGVVPPLPDPELPADFSDEEGDE